MKNQFISDCWLALNVKCAKDVEIVVLFAKSSWKYFELTDDDFECLNDYCKFWLWLVQTDLCVC